MWHIFHDIFPLILSDEVTCAVGISLSDEHGSSFKSHVEGSNHIEFFESQFEQFLAIHLVSEINGAFLKENNFVDFLQLVADDLVGQCHSWLQLLENLKHEFLVEVILPGEQIKTKRQSHLVLVFKEGKEPSKSLQEMSEHEFGIDLSHNFTW